MTRPHAHPLAIAVLAAMLLTGCISPSERLRFPERPLEATAARRAYDTDADGRAEFAMLADDTGRIDVLAYDDDEDGDPDRLYRLSQYASETVPHLIVMLDSIPFESMRERYEQDHWTWFDPPQKVIPPFPSMSGVIFTRLLGAPPLPGVINRYYDRVGASVDNMIFSRVRGRRHPWEQRLHYRLRYWENGLSFLRPRTWFGAELARAKKAFDRSPDRVTIVYLASTAGMVSKYGRDGVAEVLDGLEQLCAQILAERRGAVKITVMADHGHSLIPGERIDPGAILRGAGFKIVSRLRGNDDAVVEHDGLMNYAGIHTRRPADAARALAADPRIELAIYQDGERVTIRGAHGAAAVERAPGPDARYRYTPIDHDVLGYAPVVQALAAAGRLDADGFAADDDWFDATLNHRWPDAPDRLWDAFHGLAINTPDVMITTRPGFYSGLPSMEMWVTMASTHGGLDQADSATFVMTMTGRADRPMRAGEVLRTIEPDYNPAIRRD